MSTTASANGLADSVAARENLLRGFVGSEAERTSRACHEIARSFSRGGTLICYGSGTAVTDAAHAAVEFMHPIVVGKRALPALSASNGPVAAASARALCGAEDIALALTHQDLDGELAEFLALARGRGALTIAMTGSDGGPQSSDVDFMFTVPSDDAVLVQEVQETLYHVFWELVHTFFEHPGLLEESCITCGDVAVTATVVAVDAANATIERGGAHERIAIELIDDVRVGDQLLCHAGIALERLARSSDRVVSESPARTPEGDDPSGFLYPFLDRSENDLDAVLAAVRTSTLRKAEDVIELRSRIAVELIVSFGQRVRERLDAGGRLLAFGNGGSATDAQDLAADAVARGWPAVCLTDDAATLTAVANDVGFEKTFSRQLIPLARAGDVAVGISTSGSSANVFSGLEMAGERGLLTCAITGYDGGRLAELESLDQLFVVESDYVPRIQEAQATIYHLLLETIGARG